MLMKRSFRKQNSFGFRAQAMVEFAIAAPILFALLIGIFEVGRLIFIYTAVTNASREAVRFGSALGYDDDGYLKYRHCAGIRNMARRSAYFLNLQDSDIIVEYDHGPGTSSFVVCDASSGEDADVDVNTGSNQDRVTVEVTAQYSPFTKLIPIGRKTLVSKSARTILGLVELGSSAGPTNTPVPSGPSNTPTATVPSNTPTATVPSNTPTNTPTNAGPVFTLTPLLTSTPTLTPTITPTFTPSNTPTVTPTPTNTFTPTATSTPVPGCGNIIAGWITVPGAGGNKTMSMTIINPHDSITVLNVQVAWNSVSGGSGNPGTLTLKSVSLGTTFWTGSSTAGSGLTITPSTTVTIPGNNTMSTIIFTFDKNYQSPSGNSITINLSTPGCESYPINGVNP
jgi:Flp pilus assembly protein TadG